MTRLIHVSFVVALLLPNAARTEDRADLLIANFESETYGDWKATGKAFGEGPSRGALPGQMNVEGFLGKRLVNSFAGGDDATGTLTSPEFTIERKHLAFLIGGGNHPGKACINLLVDGKPVRTASGPNSAPGGSERLEWHSWDVADLSGKKAVIEIVDNQKGGWGHVNIDEIIQTNRRRGASLQTREIEATKRYLHVPVKTGAAKRVMRVRDGDKVVREFEIEVAESKDATDFVAFLDLSPWKGKKLVVETTLPADSKALELLSVADELPAADRLYSEKHRPQFHFTSRRGWLNDPNGLVYLEGEYHLFYQHNPYGWNWGNMHWGHAVSRDLVHWQELPIALYPHRYGDMAFSGSAVIDKQNTSGFKSGDIDVMVAAYTSTGRGECIVYSNDRGRTWKEYEKNPVIKHTGRDPRLLWHEPTKRWVMAVYNEDGGRSIKFHTSSDLKTWKYESKVDNFFECPDLVEMPVDGDQKNKKWILYGADGEYLIGHFDGREFKKESGKHRLWHGNFYAAQTFTNTPDNRVIQIGWGQNITFPNMPFNQQMCVPVELTLRKTDDGPRLFAVPVKELIDSSVETGKSYVDSGMGVFQPNLDAAVIDLSTDVKNVAEIAFEVWGAKMVFNKTKQTLTCQKVTLPVRAEGDKLSLRILVDRGSIEIFANEGRAAASVAIVTAETDRGIRSPPGQEHATITTTLRRIKSTWTNDR